MTQRHQQQAEKIVAAFADSLDEGVRTRLTSSQLNNLTLMIQKALGDEIGVTIEHLEELIRTLRTETEKPELEI